MKWRKSNISNTKLIILAAICIVAVAFVRQAPFIGRVSYLKEKIKAAEIMQAGLDAVKQERIKRDIKINRKEDINQTGLIGPAFSIITTDRGDLIAKRTSVNPNWAPAIADLLNKVGVENGDVVALGMTGSFPALNIAAIAAVEAIGAKAIIVSSLGASMWGATDTGFTWLDMENSLYKNGILKFKSIATSYGGKLDRGGQWSKIGLAKAKTAVERNNLELIYEDTLESSINKRMALYNKAAQGRPIKAFVNVGGGLASLGSDRNMQFLPAGIISKWNPKIYDDRGIVYEMLKKKIPAINILNIDKLASEYDLPRDPRHTPKPGQSGLFTQRQYDIKDYAIIGIIFAALIAIIIVVVKPELKNSAGV